MALEKSSSFMKCLVISTPQEYIKSLIHVEQIHEGVVLNGMKSNSLIVNESTSVKIGLCRREGPQKTLIPVTFKVNVNKTDQSNDTIVFKRKVYVVVDECVSEDTIVLSDELLFNLQNISNECMRIHPMNCIFLTVHTEVSDECTLPSRASKVIISLFQSKLHIEDNSIDEFLKSYFQFPIYLCEGDVFGVEIDKDSPWCLNNNVMDSTIYFKVIELQGPAVKGAETSKGYFVDNLVTLYQSSNCQGFFPRRNIHLSYNSNLHYLLGNDVILKNLKTHGHCLVPLSFNDIFNNLCYCMKPFLLQKERVDDLGLNPLFLLSGPNGSGKSLLLQSVCEFFGVRYWRVDCVNVGGAIPGQGESKLKTIFNQLKSIVPCILHLSNIEALCKDADNKEDVRLLCCFEQQLKQLQLKWPVVIVATSHSSKSVSSILDHLFLDTVTISTPNCQQREDIISWLFHCCSESIDQEMLQTIASQTSGFVYRDLEVLVRLAFKERFKRSKDETNLSEFVLTDFTKVIGTMHKAFSESIGAPKVPSVMWKDVGGLEHLKKEILRSLRSNMFNSGLKRSGLLLHGPPGTGKTLLAKAVATQCSRNFLSVKGPELLNMYVGQSEQNVRDLFEMAKAASPCIIFFDELDSLAPNRGRSGDSGGVMDRVVSQLLAEMDHLSDSSDVFILGATNRPDLIDPALLRPGRLDKLLYVGPREDRNSQLGVLSALSHKLCLNQDVDLQEIVSLLPMSVTGAQLSAVCSSAWMSAARHIINNGEGNSNTVVKVNREHFISAVSAVFR